MQRASENPGLYQSFLDAGFSAEQARQQEKLAACGEWSELLGGLATQKKHLLFSLHKTEKQIDCLDFLIYDIHKKHKGEF